MEQIFMLVGFILAAYAVVGNDSIQTLGTFLSSNKDKKWYVLWVYIGSILALVLIYGWWNHNGDVSYGRIEKVGDLPESFTWWHILPPITLIILTRFAIPVSTTFLIISLFKAKLISDMLIKSMIGYVIAFVLAIGIYYITAKTVEKKFIHTPINKTDKQIWTVFQWFSTAFLWSQWLIQDLANIYIYLPRSMNLTYLLFSLIILLGLQGFMLHGGGGTIQKIVTSKFNTNDIRSATIIDFLYALILLFLKEYSKIPMSTTWVFIGLLAGRELMMNQVLKICTREEVLGAILKDLGKVCLGLVISIILVFIIKALH